MACYLNIFRSLTVKQTILGKRNCCAIFGRQIHSNFGTIDIHPMDQNHLSLTANDDVACASYKSTKNLREIVKNALVDSDESTKVRMIPSRKPIPLPEDDYTNTMLRKNYSRPIWCSIYRIHWLVQLQSIDDFWINLQVANLVIVQHYILPSFMALSQTHKGKSLLALYQTKHAFSLLFWLIHYNLLMMTGLCLILWLFQHFLLPRIIHPPDRL